MKVIDSLTLSLAFIVSIPMIALYIYLFIGIPVSLFWIAKGALVYFLK